MGSGWMGGRMAHDSSPCGSPRRCDEVRLVGGADGPPMTAAHAAAYLVNAHAVFIIHAHAGMSSVPRWCKQCLLGRHHQNRAPNPPPRSSSLWAEATTSTDKAWGGQRKPSRRSCSGPRA